MWGDALPDGRRSTERSSRAGGWSRRSILAGAAVAASGCTRLPGAPGAYDRADLSLSLDLACRPDESDEIIATITWQWATDDGGVRPADVARIAWDDRKWTLAVPEYETTDTVSFGYAGGTEGRKAVGYEHHDRRAEAGTTYAASCTLSPAGDFTADERTVVGAFAHVRERREGTPADGRFGHLDQAWTAAVESDQAAATCPTGDG